MKKFDEIAKQQGWIKPYDEVPLWYKKVNDHNKNKSYIGKFSIAGFYENLKEDEIISEVENIIMNYFSGNLFLRESREWALPMLASDYYANLNFGKVINEKDHSQELKYALMAIKANPKLKPESFSKEIRNMLEPKSIMKKKIYYAHSLHLYNTEQEKRDILMLEQLGFEVFNPNESKHQEMADEIKQNCLNEGIEDAGSYIMDYFETLVKQCDAVAFRAHPHGKIPAGVGKEIKIALNTGKSIIQLPNLLESDFMSVQETREWLKLLGNR